MLGGRNGSRTGTAEHDLQFFEFFARHLDRIQQSGAADNGGTVLIVVENRDRQSLPQLFFDVEAFGRGDILEIDAADGGLEQLAEANDLVRLFAVQLEVEDVDIGKP